MTAAELDDFKKLKKLIDDMAWLSKGMAEKANAISKMAKDFAEIEE